MSKIERENPKRSRIAMLIFVACSATFGGSRIAAAATIPVNASCSLRDAASAANYDQYIGGCQKGDPGHDLIELPIGTILLESPIEIWGDVTIQGQGMGQTYLQSSSTSSPSPDTWMALENCGGRPAAIYINSWDDSGPLPINIEGLTLHATPGVDNQGICVVAGSLMLSNTRVTGFYSRGIWAQNYAWLPVSFSMELSIADNNHAHNDGFGGAGIFYNNIGPGDFNIRYSRIQNNFSEGNAGGIFLSGTEMSNRHIIQTHIMSNTALLNGGGLYDALDASYLELDQVTLAFNHASGVGGGIYKPAPSNLSFLNGTFVSNNSVDGDFQQANLNLYITNNSITCSDSWVHLQGSSWNSLNRPHVDPGDYCEFSEPRF